MYFLFFPCNKIDLQHVIGSENALLDHQIFYYRWRNTTQLTDENCCGQQTQKTFLVGPRKMCCTRVSKPATPPKTSAWASIQWLMTIDLEHKPPGQQTTIFLQSSWAVKSSPHTFLSLSYHCSACDSKRTAKSEWRTPITKSRPDSASHPLICRWNRELV